ncbi:hypothetical protein [Deinococcus aerophilus]|uniref:Outer membrane protein beta-barrel domain-containing protein n=1 Tax=Deinococcus aerophilus TaxID=522488 RepID=A0ABQ2GI71_9DEIO|nr:hypothetical protein [Deinococcus aerophilus]GGL96703.1 hypothetical protein GCM10010841_01370 [Deinococcus aerophilus]
MKKATLTLLALSAVSSASAANYIGGSIGSGVTLQYQSDLTSNSAIRYGLNLDATNFNFRALSVNGSVDYLADFAGVGPLGGFTPYYGVGLGVGAGIGENLGLSVYPHGTLGLRYNVTDPLSLFVEGNVGLQVQVGSGTNTTNVKLGSNARIGLNYRLP